MRGNGVRPFWALSILGLTAVGGCGSDAGNGANKAVARAGILSDAQCPQTVVIQTDWFPEAEHGAVYQLMGAGAVADKNSGSVVGPLVFHGVDTGVQLNIRSGGPFLGNQTVVSQMYQNPEILLGLVTTDESIKNAADFPTIAVLAPQEKSPQIIMWDALKHPTARTIADIAKEVDTITVFGGSTYVDYLIASGYVPREKVDFNYLGNKLLATDGATTAHQGFATSEPFQYAHLDTGAITTAYQMIYDTGWDPYPETFVVQPDKVVGNAKCLHALVPMLQQAQLDYVVDHAAADRTIIDSNTTYASFWKYTQEDANFAVTEMLRLGIIANGTTRTFGDLEDARLAGFIAKAVPIFQSQGVAVSPTLKPSDIADNEFLDPNLTYSG